MARMLMENKPKSINEVKPYTGQKHHTKKVTETISKILLCMDGSKPSLNASKGATDTAKGHKAEVLASEGFHDLISLPFPPFHQFV